MLKKVLVSSANRWISTGSYPTEFLVHYGAKRERVSQYPFSSVFQKDIAKEITSAAEKELLRQELGIPEKKVLLSIGQFIHRKGFDILLRSAASLDGDTGIYIVGGEPTEEYKAICEELGLSNVHFLTFMKKEKLVLYYKAADLFVLPTRRKSSTLMGAERSKSRC